MLRGWTSTYTLICESRTPAPERGTWGNPRPPSTQTPPATGNAGSSHTPHSLSTSENGYIEHGISKEQIVVNEVIIALIGYVSIKYRLTAWYNSTNQLDHSWIIGFDERVLNEEHEGGQEERDSEADVDLCRSGGPESFSGKQADEREEETNGWESEQDVREITLNLSVASVYLVRRLKTVGEGRHEESGNKTT